MSVIFNTGFDHYGDGLAQNQLMTQGDFAEIIGSYSQLTGYGTNPSSARTGPGSLVVVPSAGEGTGMVRLVLPATYSRLLIHEGFYFPSIPIVNDVYTLVGLRSNANVSVGAVVVQSNGAISIKNAAGAELGVSAANTVVAGTWNHLQVDWTVNAATGAVAVYVNTVLVLNLTGINTGATNIGMLRWHATSGAVSVPFYIDDLIVSITTGTYNTTLLGDARVNTTLVNGNGPQQGWTPQTRFKFGNGILSLPLANTSLPDAIYCADSANFRPGTGDFVMEGFFRFLSTPTGTNYATLFSKWRESTNERSYQLVLGGPSFNAGKLTWRVSTDGQAGTVTNVLGISFTPVYGHWHHIAVQRSAGFTTIFVDGVAYNAPVADANNYNGNTSLFTVGGQQDTASPSMLTNTGFQGFQEELRITMGVARYTGGFVAPTAAYPRTLAGDPLFNSVVLLAGWDSTVADESSFGRSITTVGGAARFAVDDSGGAYQTINNEPARDDTYVEAPFVAAASFLTFTGQPANNETVTFDGVTYTFKNPFVNAAGNVKVDATTSASIDNLVAAINGGAGAGTLYGTGTTPSTNATASNVGNGVMFAVANVQGTAGNAIGTTETVANAAWTAATLIGGTNIPGPSTFTLVRLPPGTTGVRSLTIAKRARKTDAGPGSVQAAFLTANLSSANGANLALTTTLTYSNDIIEQDPNTAGALTPASFIGATVRVDRTA